MTRKALTLGIAFILVIGMLSISLITNFTQDADAHPANCVTIIICKKDSDGNLYDCIQATICVHYPNHPNSTSS